MIYVDQPVFKFRAKLWCHMTSDTSQEELHKFAQKIGLRRQWFQHGNKPTWHYDLSPLFRARAVANGAKEISCLEMGRLIMRRIEAAEQAAAGMARQEG